MWTDDNGIVRFDNLDEITPLQTNLNAALESVSTAVSELKERRPVVSAAVLVNGSGTLPNTTVTGIDNFANTSVVGNDLSILGGTIRVNTSGWYSYSGTVRFSSGGSNGNKQVRISGGSNALQRAYAEIRDPTGQVIAINATVQAAYLEAGSVISLSAYQSMGTTIAYSSFFAGGTSLSALFLGV